MFEMGVNIESLLEQYLQAKKTQEEIEASVKQLGAQLLQILEDEHVEEKAVGDRRVRRIARLTFQTSVAQARELQATEMVEQVNKEVLKRLHTQGVEVPGATISTYVRIFDQVK